MGKKRFLIVTLSIIFLVFDCLIALPLLPLLHSSPFPTNIEQSEFNEPSSTYDAKGMNAIERAATQTALALLGTVEPSETPAPEVLKDWLPATNSDFRPRFSYDSNRWAMTDINTLASSQMEGCVVRIGGGYGLQQGWSTEESTLQAGDFTFMVIVMKDENGPRFATYSTKNGTVFEINSANNFAPCQQAGERILKTISIR